MVHFSIQGEFITEHARNLWGERKFTKAFDLLECVIGTTREQHEAIIFGTKQLVGTNDVELVDDNWTPPPHYCASLREALQQGEHFTELERRREDAAWDYARDNWLSARGREKERRALFAKLQSLVGEKRAQEIADFIMMEYAQGATERAAARHEKEEERRSSLLDASTLARHSMEKHLEALGLDASALPSHDAIVNRGRDIIPALDEKMESANGWLLRDGKYYGCSSMEHVGLAAALLPDAKDGEQEAERLGWVKLAKTAMGFYCLCSKTPNKKQLAKLFDYSQVHGRDYEEMIALFDIND